MALAESFHFLPTEHQPVGASDRRLVHLSARLAAASSPRDLEGALGLIAAELGSTKVCLSAYHAEPGLDRDPGGERRGDRRDRLRALRLPAERRRPARPGSRSRRSPATPRATRTRSRSCSTSASAPSSWSRSSPAGQSIGIIEAYRRDERAWTRAEVNRARVIANQFAVRDPDALGNRGAARQGRAHAGARASAGRGTRAARSPGRPHIWTTSARPSLRSRTISSPSIPSSSSIARSQSTVSAAAAWPKLWATLIRQCQSAFEYGWALIWVMSTRRVDVAVLVGDPQVAARCRSSRRAASRRSPGSVGEGHEPQPTSPSRRRPAGAGRG